MSEKVWSDEAWDDYLYWQIQDRKTLKRINQLLRTSKGTVPCMALGIQNR